MAGTLFWIDAIQVFIGAETIHRRTSTPFIRGRAGWRGFASRSCPT